jgi:hypothetical protein
VELGMVVLGAVLATYGWYWGGVTESRTSAYAMGAGAFMLGLAFAFGGGGEDVVTGSFLALGAVYALLATANAWNESAQDRTYGMFALLFGIVALFGFLHFADEGAAAQLGFGALALGATLILHFISASLVPTNRGFKAFVGWVTLFAGAALILFGFADVLNLDLGTL